LIIAGATTLAFATPAFARSSVATAAPAAIVSAQAQLPAPPPASGTTA